MPTKSVSQKRQIAPARHFPGQTRDCTPKTQKYGRRARVRALALQGAEDLLHRIFAHAFVPYPMRQRRAKERWPNFRIFTIVAIRSIWPRPPFAPRGEVPPDQNKGKRVPLAKSDQNFWVFFKQKSLARALPGALSEMTCGQIASVIHLSTRLSARRQPWLKPSCRP